MKRATPGQTTSWTFDVSTASGTGTVNVTDWKGYKVNATVQLLPDQDEGPQATVTIAADAWNGGRPGFGRVEVIDTNGSVKTIIVQEQFRIMPGIQAERDNSLYSDYGLLG